MLRHHNDSKIGANILTGLELFKFSHAYLKLFKYCEIEMKKFYFQ